MKTYQVVLTKSYVVTVNAETKEKAKRFTEFYTGDIQPLLTLEDAKREKFFIEDIECAMNESFEAEEIKG